MSSQYLVVMGDVLDGFIFRGPFSTPEEARDYVSLNFPDEPYVMSTLEPPE